MKRQLCTIVCVGALGVVLMGCATRGHSFYVGTACFHRAYNILDIYHCFLMRNSPDYDKVIVSPEWQEYPVLDLQGLKIDLNACDLVGKITNNPSCHVLDNGEIQLSVADKYIHLITRNQGSSISRFLLTNADLKFPCAGSLVSWPYSATELSLSSQRSKVSDGGVFLVYGKPEQWDGGVYDLIFDIIPEVNKVGRFAERYPLISFAGYDKVDGKRKRFLGLDGAENPKDEFFDLAIFRLDGDFVRYIRLPNGRIISPCAVTLQSLIDLGFAKVEGDCKGVNSEEEKWRLGSDDAFVEVTFCRGRISRLCITTGIFCKNGQEMLFPIQETRLKNQSQPDYVERRTSK